MHYETAAMNGRTLVKPPADLKAKPRTPRSLEREAEIRRIEIRLRINDLRGFIKAHSGKDHYRNDLRRWRHELIALHEQLL